MTGTLLTTNSTTYIDTLGVFVGLERFPGEPSDAFLNRMTRAVSVERGAGYEGFLNELSIQLGLPPRKAILVGGNDYTLSCSISGLRLESADGKLTVPLVEVDGDGLWEWKKLSEVVAAINSSPAFYAELDGEDGPALQLVRQSNLRAAIGVELSGQQVDLEYPLIPGTEILSGTVPDYYVSAGGRRLDFVSPVPDGTTITYLYRICPYVLIAFPASTLNLSDPDLAAAALSPDNQLAYQVREYLQALMERDRTFWSR
jgi:hypothetical protein